MVRSVLLASVTAKLHSQFVLPVSVEQWPDDDDDADDGDDDTG